MLNQATIEIIKSTVPVLEVHGEEITRTFYSRMFEAHPELLNIFNHANQKQGRQQKALANTVYAAAKYIDQLETILPAVVQIAHKHRSLGILPEHYPIVGEYLLLAIKEVLKDAATPEIIQAWADAYQVIADVFIETERKMYEEAANQEGGWDTFKTFKISRIEDESDVIKSFYLVPADGGALAGFVPGQYISVKVNIPGEENTHIRQYSLSDSPNGQYYRISVKKEAQMNDKPAGKVSVFLHEGLAEGDEVAISAPAGEFILNVEEQQPVVLLSGGVGITPMMSMLEAMKQRKQKVTFIHAAINGRTHAFAQEVKAISEDNDYIEEYVVYEQPASTDECHYEGHINEDMLNQLITDKESIVYMCGPVPFMKAMHAHLIAAGIKENHIRFEFFGPAMQL